MGLCLDTCRYELQKAHDPDAWRDWHKHQAQKDYKVVKRIGKGAFSEVLAAEHRATGELVALKVVFLGDPHLRRRQAHVLQSEPLTLARIGAHANIVGLRHQCTDPVRLQCVMELELCRGGTLLQELGIAKQRAEDDRVLASIAAQLFAAAAHTHAAGFVHRDIKPENIVFRSPRREWGATGAEPVLVDFGMALDVSTPVPKGGREILGSSGYIAPEVIDGGEHTAAMDMYALGVTLFQAVAGVRPMTRSEAMQLKYAHYEAAEYPRMKDNAYWITAEPRLKDLILGLLEKDPLRRLTAPQALQHPWVRTADLPPPRLLVPARPCACLKSESLKITVDNALLDSFLQALLASTASKGREYLARRDAKAPSRDSITNPLLASSLARRSSAHVPSLVDLMATLAVKDSSTDGAAARGDEPVGAEQVGVSSSDARTAGGQAPAPPADPCDLHGCLLTDPETAYDGMMGIFSRHMLLGHTHPVCSSA